MERNAVFNPSKSFLAFKKVNFRILSTFERSYFKKQEKHGAHTLSSRYEVNIVEESEIANQTDCLEKTRLNNSFACSSQSRGDLNKLSSLHNLDLLKLNSDFNTNLNVNHNLPNHQQIYSWYFTPHSFKKSCDKFSNNEVFTSFSLSHNNIVSLNRNFEEIVTLLDDLDFHFNVVGVWNKNHNL